MRAVIWVLLCTLTFVYPAGAADGNGVMTGGDLQYICTNPSAEKKAACQFYILGITQGVSMGISIAEGKTKGGIPCIPDDISGSALELAVKIKLGQELMAYPEDKKLDASSLVGAILVDTFLCRKAR